jgi:hypothetical protein
MLMRTLSIPCSSVPVPGLDEHFSAVADPKGHGDVHRNFGQLDSTGSRGPARAGEEDVRGFDLRGPLEGPVADVETAADSLVELRWSQQDPVLFVDEAGDGPLRRRVIGLAVQGVENEGRAQSGEPIQAAEPEATGISPGRWIRARDARAELMPLPVGVVVECTGDDVGVVATHHEIELGRAAEGVLSVHREDGLLGVACRGDTVSGPGREA